MQHRADWRIWLEKNHSVKSAIWLLFYKKHTGKLSISYTDAVEEALCFGWIDSIVKRIDDEKYTQKYTPRKKKSIWSKKNKERVEKMIRQGRMTEAGSAKIREAKDNGEWDKAAGSLPDNLTIPPDFQQALAANPKARKNFQNFASSYQKQYIGWITSAKREETRQKRIQETIRRVAQNKKPGMK